MKKFLFFLVILGVNFVSAQTVNEGILLYNAGKISEAQTVFEQILIEKPNDVRAIEYLGDVYFKQGKWSKAAAKFKQLVSMDSVNATYHFKYAGAIGLQAKHNKLKALFLIDDIKYHFEKAATLDADFVDPRLALVQLYTELPNALGGSKLTAEKYAEQIKLLNLKAYKEALTYIKG